MMIRVFVGCAPDGMDAESCSVLEWSIRKHTKSPIEFEWMILSRDPASFWYGWKTRSWATPFSGFRWAVPEFCGFAGKAIYTDSDVIFMADIAELWNQSMNPGKVVLAKGGGSPRYCVSLWDCAGAQEHIPPVAQLRGDEFSHQSVRNYFAKRPQLTQSFDGDWNCCDGQGHENLRDGVMKALHYTAIDSQVHLKYAVPRLKAAGMKHWFDGKTQSHPRKDLQDLFDELLTEAGQNGYGVHRYTDGPFYGEIAKASLGHYNRAKAISS